MLNQYVKRLKPLVGTSVRCKPCRLVIGLCFCYTHIS
nr:MAG TPA: hypothetical protein [Caudoviricetes sp.]